MTVRNHRFTLALVALVLAAIVTPTAVAAIDQFGYNPEPGSSSSHALPLGVERTASGANPATQPAPSSSAPTTVRVVHEPSDDGFSWGDAGIGAGAGFALTMIALGGLLVLTNRRHRAEQPAPTA